MVVQGSDATFVFLRCTAFQIPVVLVKQSDGKRIEELLADGSVFVQLSLESSADEESLDGK